MHQLLNHTGTELLRNQIVNQRDRLSRLTSSGVVSFIGLKECLMEPHADFRRNLRKTRCVIRLPEQCCCVFEHTQVLIIESRRHYSGRRLLGRPGRARPDVVPVAQTLIEHAVRRNTREIISVTGHCGIVFGQHAGVAEPLIQHPRNENHRTAPLWRIAERPLRKGVLRSIVRNKA